LQAVIRRKIKMKFLDELREPSPVPGDHVRREAVKLVDELKRA
jgi:hypothetical protein